MDTPPQTPTNLGSPPTRSASVGAIPREKKHYTSRVESASGGPLDVRCACQYFQCDSLLPDRVNPVGSRPESKQGYASDMPQFSPTESEKFSDDFLLPNSNQRMQFDQVSTRSFGLPSRGRQHDKDRVSVKSFPAQISFDQISNRSASRHHDLDEISNRGLVVRSISDATDPDRVAMGPVLSRNQREMSSDRVSNRSYGIRDPDTISNRSVTLRRISRSPSKTDLFVADINVPMQYGIHSRRSSKMEIPHFNIIAPTPTPTPGVGMAKPEFSVYEEFRKNKVAQEQEKENLPGTSQNNFKQNQPIPVFDFTNDSKESIIKPTATTSTKNFKQNQELPILQKITPQTSYQSNFKQNQPIPVYEPPERNTRHVSPPPILDVATLPPVYQETTVPINKIEVPIMSIEMETIIVEHQLLPEPPPLIVKEHPEKIQSNSMFQEPEIPDNSHSPFNQSALPLKRQYNPKFDISPVDAKQKPTQLSLPYSESKSISTSRQSSFRRFFGGKQKSEEQQFSEESKRKKEDCTITREKSPMQFFSSKQKSQEHHLNIDDDGTRNRKEKSPSRERSPMRFFGGKQNIEEHTAIDAARTREKSKSPSWERSPNLHRSKPQLVVMSADDNQFMSMSVSEPRKVAMTDSKTNQPTATTVQETFSLKVDELDQYSAKPKPAVSMPSIRSSQNLKVSTINLSDTRKPADIFNTREYSNEPTPQPVESLRTQQPQIFVSRQIASSQPDLSIPSGSDISHRQIQNKIQTNAQAEWQTNKNLISVNIGIDEPEYDDEQFTEGYYEEEKQYELSSVQDNKTSLITKEIMNSSLPRAPSEQRIRQSSLLRRKNYFDRTQSQDRANSSQDSANDITAGRMMKTVSFDFAGHNSRVDDNDKINRESVKVMDKNQWLEKTYFKRDHEYEPIGEPQETTSILKREGSPVPPQTFISATKTEILNIGDKTSDGVRQAEELQRDLEDRYFSSSDATTPRTESRTDYDIHTSQVDSSALEELPLKGENRKKGFMASAQDRSRKLQAGIRTQAGKVKTKFRGMKKQPSATAGGSPRAAKERKKFKAPEFKKMKMPEIPKFKSPEMPKFKKPEFKKMEFKRPEFTKFNKPDMSKFKIPEKFSSLKLKRSKSLKEEGDVSVQTGESGTTPDSAAVVTPAKKKFEFNFGTYPRALRRKKIKDSIEDVARANEVSTVPSSETPPSMKSATILRGTREEGPVGSRWQDKFSDVSFGDSESGRFQRYGSEVESFERESSMERRMKDDLVAQEDNELTGIGIVEQKQFADYDEENRAIHEISKIREGEFKQRRPMIHQDSNLSEESKDVGWTEKDVLRNKRLRRAEMEMDEFNTKYESEEGLTGSVNTNHETQSTGSSGAKKGVIEEIDDDEFFLRKRGISQDNIEIRQYISSAIREGFDNPVNSLAQLGSQQDEYPDSMLGSSQDQRDFGYDVPPTKPRRLKNFNNFDRKTESQEIGQGYDEEQKENYDDNTSFSQTGSDYFQNIPPSRPLRKSKKGYSQDSQSDIQNMPYFDDEEKEPYHKELNLDNLTNGFGELKTVPPPQVPKRRKKQTSEDKDIFFNGFGGRSISNSYLQSDNQPEEVIVYRTEHEYKIPLAQSESLTTPAATVRRSKSRTTNDDDDGVSREADSLVLDGMQIAEELTNEKFTIEMKENDGYAVVRKEPPPRPPPPVRRRKRATRSPGHFATMPHSAKGSSPPERPKRNYSTIGPSRPPRRKTSFGSVDIQKSASDITQYEELELEDQIIEQADLQKNLQSGDVIKKMKYRPLPPPPPPPREKKGQKHHGGSDRQDKDDHDGGAEKMMQSDIQMNGNYDIEKTIEKCIEVEVSTQTDPLPDDFECEEFEITEDMKVIEPRNSKTLEDILREEQDIDIEYNKWANEDNLTKGIQRFRDANQRSFSEKSKASSANDRSKSLSRPQTPSSAIVIEKRVPTPVPNNASETMLQASLTVQPIDDLDFDENFNEEYPGSRSYQSSTVKSVDSQETANDNEKERLNEFIEEERRIRQEILQKEEEEEREILEKIRELQRLEEEEERKTMQKLRELEMEEEQNMKYKTEQQREEDELKKREEEDRKIMEKIRELERQEEEDRKIMEKIRELEKEYADSEKSPDHDIGQKPDDHEFDKQTTESPQQSRTYFPDPEVELIEPEMSPPPNPPPRKRSSTNVLPEDRTTAVAVDQPASLAPVAEQHTLSVTESTEPNVPALPSRMALADLEVERLRVHALQAGHIMVSSLHGAQIGADELECKSGNLVVRNLELPAGFIEDLVERVRTSERSHTDSLPDNQTAKILPTSQTESAQKQSEVPPERPPLPQQPLFPSEYMHSIPPASFFQLRNPDDEDYQPNMQAPRRRRHHRRRDSSSEDSHHRHRSRGGRSPEPTVAQLGGQFLQACGTSLLQSMSQVANYVRTNPKEAGGEKTMSTLIAIFILMILGFLFVAMSGKNIHHHHWDFFNPPGNEGRQQQ